MPLRHRNSAVLVAAIAASTAATAGNPAEETLPLDADLVALFVAE